MKEGAIFCFICAGHVLTTSSEKFWRVYFLLVRNKLGNKLDLLVILQNYVLLSPVDFTNLSNSYDLQEEEEEEGLPSEIFRDAEETG